MERVTENKCLLCYQNCGDSTAVNVDDKDFRNAKKDSKSVLDGQLIVIFTLRKLLEVPESFCENLLPQIGNPDQWIACCPKCSNLIDKAHVIFNQIIKLQNQFDILRGEIRHTLEESQDSGSNLLSCLSTSDKIRQFFFNGWDPIGGHVTKIDPDVLKYENEEELEDSELGYVQFDDNGEATDENNDGNCITDDLLQGKKSLTSKRSQKKTISKRESRQLRKRIKKRKSKKSADSNWEAEDADGDEMDSESGISESNEFKNACIRKKRNNYNKYQGNFFKCELCETVCTRIESLRSHVIRRHTKDLKHECDQCQKKFAARKDLNAHYRRMHPEAMATPPTTVICELCGKSFREDYIKAHYKLSHDEKEHVCHICNKRYENNALLRVHHRGTHYKELNLEPYQCKECDKIFRDVKYLRGHVKSAHTKVFTSFCSICNAGFIKNKTMRAHVRRVHEGERNFSCSHCGQTYFTKGNLESHIIRKHTKDFRFICNICGKGHTSKTSLDKHMVAHVDSKLFTCELCGDAFKQESGLKMHQRGKHYQELNLDPFSCNVCGKIFNNRDSLKFHNVKEHTKVYKYSCSTCDKKFLQDGALQEHIRRHHTGEKPFQCSFCGESFFTRRSLTKHNQKHTEFKHKCTVCQKGFVNMWLLNRHMSIHK